ncbi:hypothetical protein AURDEDRAFT_115357 [Auricularia subglabra TFB-10046 SS5]|nr:hypothetical protein AURDEDRAFT_115357 [Auricularia subglabra TFB-10046 SS5]
MELVLTVTALLVTAFAQSSNVTSCAADRGWLENSLDQTPCLVGAFLLQECATIEVNIPQQLPKTRYPSPGDNGFPPNPCSSVGYSIMAACSFCQSQTLPNWTFYRTNCTDQQVIFGWTEGIPARTAIPAWAYDDPRPLNGWDAVVANQKALSGTPDITANSSPSSSPGASTASQPITATPAPSTSTVPVGDGDEDSGGSSHSPVGAIVGGVVGGLAALGLGAIGVALVLRCTRRKDGPQPVRPAHGRWPSSNSMISRWVKSGGQHAYSPGVQPFDQSQTTTYVAPQPSSGMNTITSSRILGYNQHAAEV